MKPFLKNLPDPDSVGSAEYRAVYELLETVEDEETAISVCEEFIDAGKTVLNLLQRETIVKTADLQGKPLLAAFFSFDVGPLILGWTDGTRRNGWGKPLFEVASLKRWNVEMVKFQDTGVFSFREDGAAVFDPGNFNELDTAAVEMYTAAPVRVVSPDGPVLVYDIRHMGLTWNQVGYQSDDPDLLQEMIEAVTPPQLQRFIEEAKATLRQLDSDL
jgi:hypothetical protein